ncbi:MAG: sigma-54-dependent Fis family transcriptional regulator [Bacteroidetes bacterium]|nr:sigma-54-dependent Fis family transcriptional regulator [Bacteroidota bacterium]MBV6460489.1 DNA-binding transcriptional regulator NtrC [Flavobacteriales bacterium]WKZ74237.1 MAG: sigma-54 dependent transcriptional regulator [Vicingaceae bacterium]MCL4815903.1 sigma-54 dependent transcriptional regulator [Flavobacteriales bacterium]NOG94750.1 sigma-54-dependent Fis family transcriptional regulator [Bacteroidota bacterium]
MDIQQVKQRFGIIGNSALLNRAIDIAMQVAPTDLSVLITGESGTGKEIMPQIIHQLSARKHAKYIAVNCGAIPEGTIDSELFGHEKGSFTGAHDSRKGYFEVADGGTIFLDEVAELPLQTQVRLLRVLETGEYIKVGSSKMQKTNVRIVAATNVTVPELVNKGKFREDLYYRLNTVPIIIPPLRERKEDIGILFRKFASDFASKYHMPTIQLTSDATEIIESYRWPGNIRQLKNFAEQISVIETEREIDAKTLYNYLPKTETSSPVHIHSGSENLNEREILYKVLFDLKRDLTDLKTLVLELMKHGNIGQLEEASGLISRLYAEDFSTTTQAIQLGTSQPQIYKPNEINTPHEEVEESLSLTDTEKELIKKALDKHRGRRKNAAKELGISERTLYRKIKEYEIK